MEDSYFAHRALSITQRSILMGDAVHWKQLLTVWSG